ncbi:MAG: hypothetical protein M3272_05965 [Actinomycetota bacterium]|nr:hypothetical protein [Actinomycetota bacterium]
MAQKVAEMMDVAQFGYAFRVNIGLDAGQGVSHLRACVVGGKSMGTP